MSLRDCNQGKRRGKGQKGKVISITHALRKRLENQSLEDVLADILPRRFRAIDQNFKAIDQHLEDNKQNHLAAKQLIEEILERLNTLGAHAFLISCMVAELRGQPLTREAQNGLAQLLNGDLQGKYYPDYLPGACPAPTQGQ